MARLKTAIWICAWALLAWAAGAGAARAQGDGSIIYNKVDAQGYFQLWQINPDGSGDVHIPADMGYPVWSWDGQLLALSSPARPFVVSWNVFVYNPADGSAQQVTAFEDQVSRERSSYVLPFFKAFSPDGQYLAISCYYRAVTTMGSSTTPILQIFGVDGNPGPFVAIASDASGHRGDGIDWSPLGDELLFPYQATAVGYPFPVTAIYALAPVSDAIATGQYRRLTFPRASQTFGTITWEEDFQPAFSPDGSQVAYIRSETSVVNGVLQFSIPSIRIVNTNGTGDHEVARFARGQYVSRVSWSPDGTRLVFDLGRQYSSGGFPLPTPDVFTVALVTMNANGSNRQTLQVPAAIYPSWNPAGAGIVP